MEIAVILKILHPFKYARISCTWSDVFQINEKFIQKLSAMFTCRDGNGGKLSNQAQKCYIHGLEWLIFNS